MMATLPIGPISNAVLTKVNWKHKRNTRRYIMTKPAMDDWLEDKGWKAKHTQELHTFSTSCPVCEASWAFQTPEINPEVHCPLCDNEDALTVRLEVQNGR
jgi:hypothetical protein